MKIRWLSIVLLIPLGAVRASASDVDEFLKNYRDARARLLNRYDNFRGSGVETETVTNAGAPTPQRKSVKEYTYLRTGDDEKLTITTSEAMVNGESKLDLHPPGAVIRRGPRLYAVKRASDKDDYSLVFVGATKDIAARDINRYRDRFFHPTCDAPGFNLPIFLDKPELSIQGVKNETRDGESLVRVDYTVTHKTPKAQVQRGWCLLRPDLDWSLREFETTYEGSTPFSYSGVVNYETGTAPKPKSIQQKLTMPTSTQVNDFCYREFAFVKSPEKDFTLAAYGLGEAESLPPRPRNMLPIWFGGIAAVALILSVLVRIIAKRRGLAKV